MTASPASRAVRRPSVGPALIVVGIAVGIVIGGVALSFATGGWGGAGSASPAGASGPGTIRVAGSPLAGVSASRALSVVASDGQPPAGISSSLVVPAGATVTSHEDKDDNAGTFDREIVLAVDATPAQVVAFYRHVMPARDWGLLPGGVAQVGQSQELFYEQAGRDGYYWQVAVIVSPVVPTLTPALGGGDQTAPTSRLELDLVQVQDAD